MRSASSGVMIPPTPITGSSLRLAMNVTTSRARSVNGRPDSPPASAARSASAAASPSRDSVVLVATSPATPCSVHTSSSSPSAWSVRSGATLTSTGVGPASARNATRSAASAGRSCRDRRPGVFGELTLTAT